MIIHLMMISTSKEEYYEIVKSEGKYIEEDCQLCIPKKIIIKGSCDASTNFIKHLEEKTRKKLRNTHIITLCT